MLLDERLARGDPDPERVVRVFLRYNPLQVAKYVKILFRGYLYIQPVGIFEFDMGKILLPIIRDKPHFSVMTEVNRQILLLRMETGL